MPQPKVEISSQENAGESLWSNITSTQLLLRLSNWYTLINEDDEQAYPAKECSYQAEGLPKSTF